MNPVSNFSDYAGSIDWGSSRDNGGINMTAGGVTIKQHSLIDMSRPQKSVQSDFDMYLQKFKTLKVGTRMKGIRVNSGYNTKNKPVYVIGRLKTIKIDRHNKQIRVFLYNPQNNEDIEVYADNLESVNESYIKTINDFIVID